MLMGNRSAVRAMRTMNCFGSQIGWFMAFFGLIDSVTLRLVSAAKNCDVWLRIIRASDLPKRFEDRIAQKFLYGDFQFSRR